MAAERHGKSRSFAIARKIAPKNLLHALVGSPLASIKRGNVCARGSAAPETVPHRAVVTTVGGAGRATRQGDRSALDVLGVRQTANHRACSTVCDRAPTVSDRRPVDAGACSDAK